MTTFYTFVAKFICSEMCCETLGFSPKIQTTSPPGHREYQRIHLGKNFNPSCNPFFEWQCHELERVMTDSFACDFL